VKSRENADDANRRVAAWGLTAADVFDILDGTKRPFVPGAVLVAEDLTGKGHLTRGIGETPRISLAVPRAG
jgi:hypothetical protein